MAAILVNKLKTPVGTLLIKATAKTLIEIVINPSKEAYNDATDLPSSEVLAQACDELDEYFAGKRKEFTVSCEQKGSDFQVKVWHALKKIPYGQTASYRDIAASCGNTNAVRAVGGANSINKIPIIIPCHRVIGKSGKLIGYSGGIATKIWLLEHERRNSEHQQLFLF